MDPMDPMDRNPTTVQYLGQIWNETNFVCKPVQKDLKIRKMRAKCNVVVKNHFAISPGV